jgi:hypothetical protein
MFKSLTKKAIFQPNLLSAVKSFSVAPSRDIKVVDKHEYKIAYWIKHTYTGLADDVLPRFFVNNNWQVLGYANTCSYLSTVSIAKQIPITNLVCFTVRQVDEDPV